MSWTRQSIADAIETEIRRMAGVGPDDPEFTRDIHIFDYGYVDSFGAVDLVSFSEQKFEIQIPDQDLAHIPMNTVNQITGYLCDRLGIA